MVDGAIAGAGLSTAIAGGPLLVAIAVAALVGLVGFLSPCVLPLVPGYLSYLAGLTDASKAPSQRRMIGGAVLFALGFTVVLVASASVLFSSLGTAIATHRVVIERVLGALTILLGVVFLGGVRLLQRDVRIRRLPAVGLAGAPLLGATFGLAWTPCLTPTFTAVVSLAATQATAERGLVLTAAYCLGLSMPFVLVASGVGWATGAIELVRRHRKSIHIAGGVLLIVIGMLLATGLWTTMMNSLRAWTGPAGIGAGL